MATRRSEWLASIKPILDRDDAKKDAVALAKELGDILEVKIDASPENLDELAKEFNAQLKTMGKQPIVFSEKTLSGIISQFTKAIAEGISAGVAKVDFSAELEKLNKQREEILKQQARAKQTINARTRMERLEDFRVDAAKLMPVDGDVAKEAQELVDILYTSADKIDEAAEKHGKNSLHYASAVMDAQEAYNDYLRMQKTLGKMDPSQLYAIPKDVRALYDKLGPDRDKYESGGGMNIPFEETFEAEKIMNSFEGLSDVFEEAVDNTTQLDKQLKQIDAQIEEVTRKARESGGIEDGTLKGAKDGLKTLNEIEAAYKRLKVANGAKLKQQNEAHIKSALDFDPTTSKVGIKSLAQDYYSAAASGDWVEEYHALLKYVKLYESYLTSTNQAHRNKVTANGNPFTPLYEQLKPMAENARNMLQNIINMGENLPLVGMGGAEKEKTGAGPTSEDVDNAKKINEVAESTAIADNKAADATKEKRIEEEKIVTAASKAADEAERELNAKKESQKYVGYRAVQPYEGSGKTKYDALEDWGAEYFSTNKDIAASYGEDFFEKGNIVIGEITPKNPLIINANGVRWDEFEKMPGVAELFPELVGLIKANPKWTGDDKQYYINNRAKAMGYDSVILENVNDALDGDKRNYELSTTIAVLDDGIVRLTGSMEQLEAGTNKFSDTISPEIPSYYVRGQHDDNVVSGTDKVEPIKKEADAHRANAEVIKAETRAQTELNNAKNQDTYIDDDAETLAKENGALADKLELLQEIAEQYGNNISQKQRDRYEELNQKDMNEGLTPKEDERYWELGEQIEEADSALEEFGQTYDKIIVKLANGKKVEILPNDQGLRTLAKIDEEYGESYNGVEIEDITFERVKQEAIATEQAVDGLNESLEKTQQLTSGNGTGTGTGDASSAELEAARAEAEQQRLANEQLVDEKLTLQNDLDVANAQIKLAQDSEIAARAELYEVEQQLADEQHEKSVYDAALTEMTDELHAKDVEIYDLREQLANVDTEVGDAKTSFDADELKNILNAITYNVKVVQDADSTENKVAIDETSLEATLTKVFTNILNPQTIQNDSTTAQSPWAHETTLQAVKSVLESMDQKIAKGGTVTKKDSGAPSKKESNNDSQKQTGRTTAIRSLTSDYEALGKLRAQYEKDGNLETKARLQNLAEEVRYKKQSLDLTTDEVIALRQRSDVAYDAEKRLIAAAKAQKAIDDKRKAADKNTKQQAKDAENAWKKRVKEAQRATGINTATSTANAGDQTVIRTIGTENLSDDVENKARELSDQIVALRKLRDEIDAKGDKATQEDRDDLSEQISKVKELKAELDGYLKVHEKYSGDNATTIEGDADVFKNLDMKAYEQQLTSAVMAATNGKAKINGFNAETKELTYTVKTGAHTFTTYTAAVDQVGNRLASLQGQTKHTETILAAITRKTKEIFTYFGGSSLVFKFFNEIKRGIQYIKEIDKALTELKKVTDETEETYERFLETAAKTGSKIGATISSVIEATATFAKLGYDMATASEMAEAALVYKNVGDNIASAEDAADSIISTLKGFGLEASESMAIVDRFNEVGNRFAITSQGIGEALRLSASALNEGGNSLDESIALITAANEVVNDPSSVGTALKTLTLRLRGSKTELEEMGEDVTDMATTTSQLQAKLLALTGGKVDIMLDANTFKNSTQILREMSAAWEDMNDIQRAKWCPYVQKCA